MKKKKKVLGTQHTQKRVFTLKKTPQMLKFSLKALGHTMYVKFIDMKYNTSDIVKEIAWVKEQRNRFMREDKQKARQFLFV